MYSKEFENFIDNYNAGDYCAACESLITELGTMVDTHRADFITLLVESGIQADSTMSDEKLIDLFVENLNKNKNLCVGASMLVNMNNKKLNFDGEHVVNNEAIKAGYDVLQEGSSNFWGALVKGGAKLAGNVIKNVQANKQKGSAVAKQKMLAASQKKKQAAAKAKAEAERKKKVKRNWIIGGSIAGLALIVGIIVYVKTRSK